VSSFFIHALVAGHYLWGGAYPVGGSGRIAETILPVIESRNGAVYTSAEVDTILVEKGKATGVRLADGLELFAPLVISDAGAHLTFTDLLPEASEFASLTAVKGDQQLSMSHVCLYVGLNRTADELGLTKPNLWVYPSDDHDQNLADYIADPDAPLPVAYISFPSAKDPDFEQRYPGKATLEVIGFAPYAWFAPWQGERWSKRGEKYEALKEGLAARLLEQLYRHVPQVEGAIEHMELSSPLSTIHFTGHTQGAVYGLAATPNRFTERRLRPRTAIKGLYLTGVDVATPGVAGGLMGAMLTASTILGRDVSSDIARGAEAAREANEPAG
jgi:phytoene dehydrogenase-like protein